MFLRHFVNKSKHYSLKVHNEKILNRNRLVFDKCLKTIIIFTRYVIFNEECGRRSAAVWRDYYATSVLLRRRFTINIVVTIILLATVGGMLVCVCVCV